MTKRFVKSKVFCAKSHANDTMVNDVVHARNYYDQSTMKYSFSNHKMAAQARYVANTAGGRRIEFIDGKFGEDENGLYHERVYRIIF